MNLTYSLADSPGVLGCDRSQDQRPFSVLRPFASPKVTIGLPVYNGVNFISETLDCLIRQTCPDFEIIICDHASSDRTQQIYEGYVAKDSRIRYCRNNDNLAPHNKYFIGVS
jgi:glycosyltransferase involved in cell wall biosynthesis